MASAKSAFLAYVSALNSVDLKQPATVSALEDVAIDPQLATDLDFYRKLESSGWTVDGDAAATQVAVADADSFSEVVALAVCLDVVAMKYFDEEGRQRTLKNEPGVQPLAIQVTEVGTGDWRVSSVTPREGEPTCSS